MTLDVSMVEEAADRIAPYVHRTPVLTSRSVDDVTGLFLFLASDESSFVHGAALTVDGGFTAGRSLTQPA